MKNVLVVNSASKEITHKINGLKIACSFIVASIVFHICVRSRTDWACCQSEKADKTECLTATCATVTKPVSKLFMRLRKFQCFGMQTTGDTIGIILENLETI